MDTPTGRGWEGITLGGDTGTADMTVTGQSGHEHGSVEGVFQASAQEKLPKERSKRQKPLVPQSSGIGVKQC